MKNLSKSFLLLLTISVLIACSEKQRVEEPKSQTSIISIDLYCQIDNISFNNGNYSISYDEVEYHKSENLEITIQNEKIELIEKQISDSAKIVMQTLNYDEFGNHKFNEQVSLKKFQSLFSDTEFERYKHIPFKIKITDDQVISIEEIYIP